MLQVLQICTSLLVDPVETLEGCPVGCQRHVLAVISTAFTSYQAQEAVDSKDQEALSPAEQHRKLLGLLAVYPHEFLLIKALAGSPQPGPGDVPTSDIEVRVLNSHGNSRLLEPSLAPVL